MKITLRGFSAVMAGCVLLAGCGTGSSVVVEPRIVPQYPKAAPSVQGRVRVAVYPAADVGYAKTRALRSCAYATLVERLKAGGYDVVPAERSKAGGGNVCVVELVDCRHDMPEWARGGSVSVVTVVAVRVRRPGRMRDGALDCGNVRSFQGVYRMKLGARPIDFSLSEEEGAAGISGAVENLMRAEQFCRAVQECGGERE